MVTASAVADEVPTSRKHVGTDSEQVAVGQFVHGMIEAIRHNEGNHDLVAGFLLNPFQSLDIAVGAVIILIVAQEIHTKECKAQIYEVSHISFYPLFSALLVYIYPV